MSKTLDEAIAAGRKLPEAAQDELAEVITRQIIDRQLALSEASLAAHGGTSAVTVFDRLIAKYAS